ncbi:MAG: histidine phosphatase family protein [Alphaproteobacteria bacterium]|nr:histidine phosphatase family protein [Alphaproteobacteria bacterium]
MSLPLIPFYFVRHGETEANVASQVAGWLDSPLTPKGRSQAEHLSRICERLEVKPTRIFHSDLSRARDTAHAVNNALNLEITEDKELREHHVGTYEGNYGWDEVLALLSRGETPDGGESRQMFFDRMMTIFPDVIRSHNEPVLIVAHGGFMHQMQRFLGQDGQIVVNNCHLHYFEPWAENEKAPWKVYVFDEIDGKVVQSPATWCPSIAKKTSNACCV